MIYRGNCTVYEWILNHKNQYMNFKELKFLESFWISPSLPIIEYITSILMGLKPLKPICIFLGTL